VWRRHLRQRLFFDMHPDGANAWTGKAVNPGNGSIYSGKMSIEGPTHAVLTDGVGERQPDQICGTAEY
jgi:uncharacterized protein (DUF2147 family)